MTAGEFRPQDISNLMWALAVFYGTSGSIRPADLADFSFGFDLHFTLSRLLYSIIVTAGCVAPDAHFSQLHQASMRREERGREKGRAGGRKGGRGARAWFPSAFVSHPFPGRRRLPVSLERRFNDDEAILVS